MLANLPVFWVTAVETVAPLTAFSVKKKAGLPSRPVRLVFTGRFAACSVFDSEMMDGHFSHEVILKFFVNLGG